VFIDNIFRFAQSGSEMSALLGRIPSAVGYQPTLASEMGKLQERITSTTKGSITSVSGCICSQADELTDPVQVPGLAPPWMLTNQVLNRGYWQKNREFIPGS